MKTYTGIILKAGVLNHNGRIYTEDAIKNAVEQFKSREHVMFGQIGYPDRLEINLNNVSHRVIKMSMKNNKLPRKKKKAMKKNGQFDVWKKKNAILVGEIEFLNTPAGKQARRLMKDCVVRPMGTGNINEEGVVENFNLISCSIVNKDTDSFKDL